MDKSSSDMPRERNSFLNNSRQIIDSPKVEHEYHNSVSGFQKKSRKPPLLNGSSLKPYSDTDSPKLPPRNKPSPRGNQMENNRDKVTRKYSDESLGNQIRNQSEKSSSNGIRNMKSSDQHMRSSISTDKSSSDLTTIKG